MKRGFIVLGLLCILAISGARWIGHVWSKPPFPLPAHNGCWDGLCFSSMEPDAIPGQLSQHPAIPADSIECVSIQPASCLDYKFLYAPDDSAPAPVTVQREAASYSLRLTPTGRPSPLHLGDLIASLGPPNALTSTSGVVELYYPEMVAIVRPSIKRPDWLHLAPTNDVVGLQVLEHAETFSVGISPTPWHGFGLYRLYG